MQMVKYFTVQNHRQTLLDHKIMHGSVKKISYMKDRKLTKQTLTRLLLARSNMQQTWHSFQKQTLNVLYLKLDPVSSCCI